MRYEIQEFAERIKEARLTQNLTQRELGDLAGLPQGQVSRIEANEVDLRLSTLLSLANALSLEVVLIPRKTSPAVKAVVRDSAQPVTPQPAAIEKELRRLHRAIRALQIQLPPVPHLDDIQRAYASLKAVSMKTAHLKPLRNIRKAVEVAQVIPGDGAGVADAARRLTVLRNSISYEQPVALPLEESRPAYSLDEEDDA